MDLAHSAGTSHTVEPELLAFGVAMLFLAVMMRPSQTGSRKQFVVALVAGLALVTAALVAPRL